MAMVARAMAMVTKRAKVTNGEGNGNSIKEGDGKSSKSDGDGIKEGVDGSGKSNGDSNKKGKGDGGKGNGNGNKGVGQGTAMATKRAMGSAMATATRVADSEENAGNSKCNCDSD
jgi:hypothetical protein